MLINITRLQRLSEASKGFFEVQQAFNGGTHCWTIIYYEGPIGTGSPVFRGFGDTYASALANLLSKLP